MPMRDKYFVYNGKSSLDFGIGISGSGTYKKSVRRVERFTVPGRNGTLTISDGTFEDIEITYPAYIVEGFGDKIDALSAYLAAQEGMVRLEDTYHPEHFRLAEYVNGIDPDLGAMNRHGTFDITFNCDGRLFLKSGERIHAYNSESFEYSTIFDDIIGVKVLIVNPTPFKSKPILYMRGSGKMIVNGTEIEITGNRPAVTPPDSGYYGGMDGSWVAIDCDSGEAYDNYTGDSWNDLLVINGSFPVLNPGPNYFLCFDPLGNGRAEFAVMPRWYIL